MPKREEAPYISQWDWVGTSEAMIERIRPKARYERAIIGAVVIVVLGLNLAAVQFRAPKPARYEFLNMGSYVVVADRRVGSVATCRPSADSVRCTEEDSPRMAAFRKEEAAWKGIAERWNR